MFTRAFASLCIEYEEIGNFSSVFLASEEAKRIRKMNGKKGN